jgi:hypothetical protein
MLNGQCSSGHLEIGHSTLNIQNSLWPLRSAARQPPQAAIDL